MWLLIASIPSNKTDKSCVHHKRSVANTSANMPHRRRTIAQQSHCFGYAPSVCEEHSGFLRLLCLTTDAAREFCKWGFIIFNQRISATQCLRSNVRLLKKCRTTIEKSCTSEVKLKPSKIDWSRNEPNHSNDFHFYFGLAWRIQRNMRNQFNPCWKEWLQKWKELNLREIWRQILFQTFWGRFT